MDDERHAEATKLFRAGWSDEQVEARLGLTMEEIVAVRASMAGAVKAKLLPPRA